MCRVRTMNWIKKCKQVFDAVNLYPEWYEDELRDYWDESDA